MTRIQWEAFALIARALGMLLFALVGEERPFVEAWRKDVIAFYGKGKK